MQSAAFASVGWDARYEAVRVLAGGLAEFVDEARRRPLQGFNVTVPHKEAVVPYMDRLDRTAQRVGAVNTVVNQRGVLIGHNTDVEGVACAVRAAGVSLTGTRVVILGAGGAARAAVLAVLGAGARAAIVARNRTRAERVRVEMGGQVEVVCGLLDDVLACEDTALLINATPVGMPPNVDVSPLPDGVEVPARVAVFDMVYGGETQLLRRARAAGCVTMDGLEMLIRQGAAAFRLWTGQDVDLEVMKEAVRLTAH